MVQNSSHKSKKHVKRLWKTISWFVLVFWRFSWSAIMAVFACFTDCTWVTTVVLVISDVCLISSAHVCLQLWFKRKKKKKSRLLLLWFQFSSHVWDITDTLALTRASMTVKEKCNFACSNVPLSEMWENRHKNWWTHSITGYVGGHTDQQHDYYTLVANLLMIFLISITYYWNHMSMCHCMWWYHDLTVVPLRFPIKYTAPSNFRWVKLPFWLTPIKPGQAKRALQAFLAKDSGVTVMTSRWRVWKPEGHTKETEISPSDRQGYMTLRVQLSKCCCCLSVVLSFSLAHYLFRSLSTLTACLQLKWEVRPPVGHEYARWMGLERLLEPPT